MADTFDPYREALVMETETIWPAEYDHLERTERRRIEAMLHADPAACGALLLGDVEPAGDSDWYCFTVATPSVVTIDVGADEADSTLALHDAGGVLVEFDDDDGPALSSTIVRFLQPGTYYAEVREFGNDAAMAYDVAIECLPVAEASESEPNDGLLDADVAARETVTRGQIDDPVFGVGDSDWFRVDLVRDTVRVKAEVRLDQPDAGCVLPP